MSLPTKKIWLAPNSASSTGRPDSLYAGTALPYITHLCGFPVAYDVEWLEWQEKPGESPEHVPIPAGIIALEVRRVRAWHGIGDGLAVQVDPMQLALRLLADSPPMMLHVYSPRMEGQLAHAVRGLVGWFDEHDGVADDFGELNVVARAKRVLENYDKACGR